MYSVIFESDKGYQFKLGHENGVVFDIKELGGVSVQFGTASTFSQIGESVITQSTRGQSYALNGVIFRDVVEKKNQIRRIMAPYTSGKIIFENGYALRVYVHTSPIFNPKKDDGRFSVQLFAPLPFLQSEKEKIFKSENLVGGFSFPINYSMPHEFGISLAPKYISISNNGDVKVPFSLKIFPRKTVSSVTLTDVRTNKFLKFDGELSEDDILSMYRDEDGFLRIEKNNENAFSMLDETSNLFEFDVGSTLILAESSLTSRNVENIVVEIRFNELIGAWYES